MGALGCGLRLQFKSDNLQPLSPGDLLTNYHGPVRACVCVPAGTVQAAWGPCSSLCRSSAQVAPARFLAAGGLGAPMPFVAVCPEFAAASQNGLWRPSACAHGAQLNVHA